MTFVRIIVLGFLVAYSWSMGQMPAHELNGFGKLVSGLFFVFAPALYLLPTYEAWKRDQPNLTSIALVNIFLGWSLIGWIVAFAWACKSRVQTVEIAQPKESSEPHHQATAAGSVPDELRKLAQLRDDGILTEVEFQAQKSKLLAQ